MSISLEFISIPEKLSPEPLRLALSTGYKSIDDCLAALKAIQQTPVKRLMTFLQEVKHNGPLPLTELQRYLQAFLLNVIYYVRSPDASCQVQTEVDCHVMDYYLAAFDMSAETQTVSTIRYPNESLLMVTCRHSNAIHLTKWLVEKHKVDVDRVIEQKTALTVASYCDNVPAIRLLMSKNAKTRGDFVSPLSAANANNSEKALECLMTDYKTKLDLNETCKGMPQVVTAAHQGHLRFLVQLISGGADINAKSTTGLTAFGASLCGSHANHPKIARYLMGCSKVDLTVEACGERPVFGAVRTGQIDLLETAIKRGADLDFVVTSGPYCGHSPLTMAIESGSKDMVHRIKSQISLDFHKTISLVKGQPPMTILQFAKFQSKKSKAHLKIYQALEQDHFKMHPDEVQALASQTIKKGDLKELRTLCQTFALKNSLIHDACRFKNEKALRFLITQFKSTTVSRNQAGESPLDLAAQKSSQRCIELLLDHSVFVADEKPTLESALKNKQLVFAKVLAARKLAQDDLLAVRALLTTLSSEAYEMWITAAIAILTHNPADLELLSWSLKNPNPACFSEILDFLERLHTPDSLCELLNRPVDLKTGDTLTHAACRSENINALYALQNRDVDFRRENNAHVKACDCLKTRSLIEIFKPSVKNGRLRPPQTITATRVHLDSQPQTIEHMSHFKFQTPEVMETVQPQAPASRFTFFAPSRPCAPAEEVQMNPTPSQTWVVAPLQQRATVVTIHPRVVLTNRCNTLIREFAIIKPPIKILIDLIKLAALFPEIYDLVKNEHISHSSPMRALISHLDYCLEEANAAYYARLKSMISGGIPCTEQALFASAGKFLKQLSKAGFSVKIWGATCLETCREIEGLSGEFHLDDPEIFSPNLPTVIHFNK